MTNEPIVLIEDNEDDIVLTRRALTTNNIRNPLVVARDGAEALELLLGTNGNTVKPAVILLDLHLPKVTACQSSSSFATTRARAVHPSSC